LHFGHFIDTIFCMRASSFLGGICFLAKTLYHKGVGVLNFHLSLQNEKK